MRSLSLSYDTDLRSSTLTGCGDGRSEGRVDFGSATRSGFRRSESLGRPSLRECMHCSCSDTGVVQRCYLLLDENRSDGVGFGLLARASPLNTFLRFAPSSLLDVHPGALFCGYLCVFRYYVEYPSGLPLWQFGLKSSPLTVHRCFFLGSSSRVMLPLFRLRCKCCHHARMLTSVFPQWPHEDRQRYRR